MFYAIRRFFLSADFYKSLTFIVATLIPILISHFFFDRSEIGFAIALGVFYNESSNSSGSVKHRTIGMCVSVLITTLATLIIGYAALHIWILLPVLGVVTFIVSYIAVYGFRASLVALSGLLAIVISFAHSYINISILDYTGLVFLGGAWYVIVVSIANYFNPKMYIEELLSDTMKLTGEFLETRAKLLVLKDERDELNTRIFKLQANLTKNHEELRDILLSNRQKSGLSNRIRRKILLFIELVDMLELAIANPVNYDKADVIFKNKPEYLETFVILINEMAAHLSYVAKVIIKDAKVSENKDIEKHLTSVKKSIELYKTEEGTTDGRDGLYMMLNLYEYQAAQVTKIYAIERVINVLTSNNSLKKSDSVGDRFLTPQDYDWNKLIVNFSLKSSVFRHALRLSIVMMIGYLLGYFFELQNSYWILLTIVVIMRPSYGLTKQRMKNRVIGTFMGALIALSIVYLIQDTFLFQHKDYVYGLLATISLILSSAIVKLNYRRYAMFLTMHISFMYALFLGDVVDVLDVIQYRVLDTLVGGGLAMLANLFLFPSWEFMTVSESILDSIVSNSDYLKKIKERYDSRELDTQEYKLSRKTAFLAMGSVNACFQRMTQEPESKRKYFSEIYDIIVLTNTFLSSLASLGTFIRKHELYQHTDKFDVIIDNILVNLTNAKQILIGEKIHKKLVNQDVIDAKETFEKRFEKLNDKYDEIVLSEDNQSLITEVSLKIRQTHVILEQLSYLFSLSENLIQKIGVYQKKIKSVS